MANREHRGHPFYIDNPLAALPPPPAPDGLGGRRRNLPDDVRWQAWRWSSYHDPHTRALTLVRLTIFKTPWLWMMLHWHHAPDQPKLHTHWSWLASFIWRGSYDEERAGGLHRRRWFNFVPRGAYHRIARVHGAARSIVVTGGQRDPVLYADPR